MTLWGARFKTIEAACDEPFREAITATVWSVEMPPAVAAKAAVVVRAAAEAAAGTVNAAVLLASVTVPPPIPDRVTVQMLDPPAPKVEGAQASDVTVAALTSPIATVREAPFREASTETVWSFRR